MMRWLRYGYRWIFGPVKTVKGLPLVNGRGCRLLKALVAAIMGLRASVPRIVIMITGAIPPPATYHHPDQVWHPEGAPALLPYLRF